MLSYCQEKKTARPQTRGYVVDSKEKIIQTTVRMPVSIHKALTDEIRRRRYTTEKTSIDRAVQEGITLWLDRAKVEVLDQGDVNLGKPARRSKVS